MFTVLSGFPSNPITQVDSENNWFLTLDKSGDFNFVRAAIEVDPYADEFLPSRSQAYTSGQNAIGAPDAQYAILYPDYEDGYISLDMGLYEEIVDSIGDDFTVEAQGGDYRVFVSDSLETIFELLGTGTNQTSYDLADSSLDEVRYVRVQYLSGDDVELDAIVAVNYNTPPADSSPPELLLSGESHSVNMGSSLTLLWTASDDTPWSYEIYENSNFVKRESWNGGNIEYVLEPTSVGQWNITLVAYDAFDNVATSNALVEVTSPTMPPGDITIILVGGIAVGVVVLALGFIWIKKK
jgi:hypothetical protein